MIDMAEQFVNQILDTIENTIRTTFEHRDQIKNDAQSAAGEATSNQYVSVCMSSIVS